MYTVSDFCTMVDTNINGFMAMLQSQSLTASTPNSYIEVSKMLQCAVKKNPAVASAYITSTSHLLVEYQLPQAAAFCDLVLLGGGVNRPQAIIIELKDYVPNNTDRPGSYEGLMWHGNQSGWQQISHPSDQVKGYVEYCRNFHSAIIDINGNVKADVNGCVFFTKPDFNICPYESAPNDNLVKEYPLYTTDSSHDLAQYIAQTIVNADSNFADKFENGSFLQNRNIMKQVAANMQKAAASGYRPFVLLDNQRLGLQETLSALEKAVNTDEKSVVIVQGPPGSGKSAVAINLFAEAVAKYNGKGNIFYVTTSSSQNDNWANVFTNAGRLRRGMGIQKSAASFKPQGWGSTAQLATKFPQYLLPNGQMDSSKYEEYIDDYLMTLPQREYGDNVDFLSVVDEAHALINPLSPYYIGHQQGFANYTGPQAYHIIRRSKVSVFFTDPDQSFRDYESTSIEDIKNIAGKLGAKVIIVDLGKMQFRCAGSVDYIEWVDNVFSQNPVRNHTKWANKFDVQIFEYPSDLENALREKINQKNTLHPVTARLLSSYTVDWKSEKILQPTHNSNAPFDFEVPDKNGGSWRKYWNNPARYDIFVQATGPSSMERDQLCEVGCPYVVRGFDYDYVGVLMLNDIVWRSGKWVINLKNCCETATKSRRKEARNEHKKVFVFPADNSAFPKTLIFFKTIRQAYRILMTRGIRGMYLCIPDEETRNHIKSLL